MSRLSLNLFGLALSPTLLTVLFTALLMATGCRTTGASATLAEIPADAVLFQVPGCLPNCTSGDQPALIANSEIEKRIVAAIDSAATSVRFSMYTFSRKPIFDALVKAASRGVRVLGIVDRGQFRTTATFCNPGGCVFAEPFSGPAWSALSITERMARAETEPAFKDGSNTDKLAILFFSSANGSGIRPLPGGSRLVHNKYVIIDEAKVLSGSGNWSSTAVSLNLENLITYEKSYAPEVVDGLVCSFDLLWVGDSNSISQKIGDCQRSEHLYLSPSSRNDPGPQERILAAIKASQSTIDISMHHLADPEVFAALIEARRRGVVVRMVVDDDDCNARPEADFLSLVEAGALVKYMPTACKLFQLSHSKYGIFDEKIVINGSANWSKAGLARNYENFVVIDADRSSDAVGAFRGNFGRLWGFGQEASACVCDRTQAQCREKYCLPEPN